MRNSYAVCTGANRVWTFLILLTFLTAFSPRVQSQSTTPYSEDFDAGVPSAWFQDTTDVMDWTLNSGTTGTANTGPSEDVFLFGGNYIYLEASGQNRGDYANLITDSITLGSSSDLHFYYHMFGNTMGALDVEIERVSSPGEWEHLWALRDDQGDMWNRAEIDLSSYAGETVRIKFRGEVGEAATGDMAIDLVQIANDVCPPALLVQVDQENFDEISLSWGANGQASFTVEYGAPGFTLGSGTTVTANTNSITVTGLNSGTDYEFYVYTNCAAGTQMPMASVAASTLDCDIPSGLTVDSSYSGNFDLSWSSVIANQFVLAVGPPGFSPAATSKMVISAVYDGSLPGGVPKGIELYVLGDIADLSDYGVGSANNGGGSDGEEFTFPAVSASAGDYIYIATESTDFTNFFGFAPDYTDGSMAINGDDAVELFYNGSVIDVYGDINVDGNGEPWEYMDGYAYRNTISASGVFTVSDWTYSGPNAYDTVFTNAGLANPMPLGSFDPGYQIITGIAGTSYTLTGLATGQYDVYVAGDCSNLGSGTSTYAGPVSVEVFPPLNCGTPITTFPSSENWDAEAQGGTSCSSSQTLSSVIWSNISGDDVDWTADANGTGSSGTGPSDDISGGGNYLYLEGTSCFNNTGILESECIDLSSLSTPSLSFSYHMYGGDMGTLEVQVRDADTDWTVLWSKSGDQGDQWFQDFVDLSGYANKTVQIRYVGMTGPQYETDMAIDEVTIGEIPNCFDLANVTYDGFSGSNANFTITDGFQAPNSYQYVAVAAGAAPSTGTAVSVTSTAVSVSGLASQTTFDLYFRGVCGGDFTAWFGPIQITTPCTGPPCDFQIGSGTSTSSRYPIYSCYGYNYSQQIYYQTEIGFSGLIEKVRFYYNSGGTTTSNWDDWVIYMGHTSKTSFTSSSDWVPFSDLTQVFDGQISNAGAAGTWIEITLDVPFSYNGTDNLVIAVDENSPSWSCTATWLAYSPGQNRSILYYSDGTNPDPVSPPSSNYWTNADLPQVQMFITPPPSCFAVTGLNADSISDNFVRVNWNSTSGGTEWEVEYGLAGFVQGSGTTVMVTDTFANISGLTSGSSYDFYVREICAPGDSSTWSGLSNVFIPFPTITSFPYMNDFEADNGNWLVSGTNASWQYGVPTDTVITTSASGTNAWVTNLSGDYNNSESSYLTSPSFDMSSLGSDPIVRFNLIYETESCCDEGWFEYSTNGGQTWTKATNAQLNGYTNTSSNWWNGDSLSWTSTEFLINGLVGNSAVQFRFVFNSDGSITGAGFGVDDFEIVIPSCPDPTAFTVDSVAADYASLTWNSGLNSTSSIIEYGPTGFALGTGSQTTGNFVSGLMSGTGYDFYLREICTIGDSTNWVGPLNVFTNCGPSDKDVTIEINTVSYGSEVYFMLLSSDLTDTIVRSFAGDFASSSTYTFNACLDTTECYVFQGWDTWGDGWNGGSFQISSGGEVYLADAVISVNGNPPVDDLEYEQIFGLFVCDEPSSVIVQNVGRDSAQVSWSGGSDIQIEYGTSGFTPGSGTIVTATGVNTITLSGLMSNTQYDVYVQSVCNANSPCPQSVSPISFGTLCDPVSMFPWSESFESGSLSGCYTTGSSGSAVWDVVTSDTRGASSAADGTYFARQNVYSTTTSNNPIFLELGEFVLPVDAQEFGYYYWIGSSGSSTPLDLEISNDNGSTWTTLFSHSTGTDVTDAWAPNTVALFGYENQTVQIRFVATSNWGIGNPNMGVDSLYINDAPPCFAPTSVSVSDIFDTQAMVSFSTGFGSSWDVAYGPTGFDPDNLTAADNLITTASAPYQITGLDLNTDYEVYVRTNCTSAGDGFSPWTGPVAFTTGFCPPVLISAFPYTEAFDTTTVTQVPCGWDFADGNGDNIQWEVENRPALAQSNPSSAAIEWNRNSAMNDMLFSPMIDLDAYEQVDVTFSYRTRSDMFVEKAELNFATDQHPDSLVEVIWSETNLTNTNYQTVTATFRPEANGEYAVVWHGISDANQFAMYIDDVTIDRTACQSPYLITLDATDFYSADISWSGEGANYIVEYGPAGFTPGTGDTMMVSGLSTTLSNLMLGTNYEVYVTTDCGMGMTSIVEGPFAFATDCPELNVTYPEFCVDASSYTLNGGMPMGGTYSGPGVVNGVFDPAVAGVGTHTITYTFPNTDACPVPASTTITVNPLPVVTVVPFGSVCIGVTPYALTNGIPAGGVYSGPGVVGGTQFDPSLAGLGQHTLTYTYTDGNGCVNSASALVNVTPLPTVTLAAQPSFCGPNDAPATLTGGMPMGGTYSGTGVVNGVFDPSIAGVGTHTITYEYSEGPGCSSTASRQIVVNQVPVVNAGPDLTINFGTNTQIQTTVTGGSGLYAYSWSPADSLVNPSAANPNTINLSLDNEFVVTVTDQQTGCTATDTVFVDVVGGPLFLDTIADVTICQGESTLLVAMPQGGSEVYSYYWTPSTNLATSTDSTTLASPMQTTTYTLTLYDGFNFRTETVTVNVLPAPQVSIGAISEICVDAAPMMLTQGFPAGGVYSGTGVSNGMFDPSVAGVGNHMISYTYTDANGCENTATRMVTVNAEPNVTLASLGSVCLDAMAFNLTGGSPAGGSYSGPGVGGGMFNPSAAGAGTHTITYTYTDNNGCDAQAQASITVFALPSVSISALGTVCVDAGSMMLSAGSPMGGTYSGNGVSNGMFDPAAAGPGFHTISYAFTNANGCTSTVSTSVQVIGLPGVSLANFSPVCESGNAMMLTGGSPMGGTYSGTGVSGGMFDPSVAGVGTHAITYTYTNSYGCTNTVTKNITVNPLPSVAMAPIMDRCVNSGAINLTGGSPSGGSYSGPGVVGGIFYPSVAGVGSHTVTYTYTNNNGCSNTATTTFNVNAAPTVSLASLSNVCVNNGPVTLSGGSPAGGTYTGQGVVAGVFYPSAVGAGTTTITYTYVDGNGCVATASTAMTVDPLPVVNVTPVGAVCINNGNVALTGGIPAGGTYSGPGVTGSTFNPVAAGAGTHVLTYTYSDGNGCTNSSNFSVTVNPETNVVFDPIADVCENDAPFQLLAGQPGGGTYTGTGVSNGMFDPSAAGVGTHTITYTYTNPYGCVNSDTQTITVLASPTVSLGSFADVCRNEGAITLTGGTPAGGTYSGPGVTNGEFTPGAVSAGTHVISYTFVGANGCSETATSTITVLPTPAQPYITQSGNTLTANTNVSGVTYQWLDGQGNAIPGATNSTYDVFINGFFYVQITDANGCSSISDIFIVDFTSLDDPTATFGVDVYPNPNQGNFQIAISNFVDSDMEVTITDAVGKVVEQFDVNVKAGDRFVRQVDLSNYSKGIYFVNIIGDDHVVNRRVVVQ